MTELAQNTDWHRWLARWDAQQAGYLPHREDRFTVIASAVAALREDPLVLDLGCGPGSLSARVLARLPAAQVVAVDADPVLLMLGRHALEHLGDRLVWVDADLRDEAWPNALPVNPPFDAVISTTALHWLHVPELASLYRRLAGLLRPGGAFLDGDHMPHDDDQPTISALARHVADAEPARTSYARLGVSGGLASKLTPRLRLRSRSVPGEGWSTPRTKTHPPIRCTSDCFSKLASQRSERCGSGGPTGCSVLCADRAVIPPH